MQSFTLGHRAYRKKALLWHPDKLEQNKSEDGFYIVDGEKVDKAKAEAMFKDLNEANEVLTDPAKKRRFPLCPRCLASQLSRHQLSCFYSCNETHFRFDTGADIEEEEMGAGGGFGGVDQADLMRYVACFASHLR
jgi:curved DNA-binding protein CbpA